jgi:hypothetical protein
MKTKEARVKMSWWRARVAIVALAAGVASSASAQLKERRPIPAAPVQTLDGATVPLTELGIAGNWVLVYVTPTSAASTRLLEALAQWQLSLDGQVVIVVADTPAAAAAFAATAAPRLSGVRWATSSDRVVWDALQLKGVPTLIGAVGGTADWRLSGVLNDPKALESVFRSWLHR